MIYVVGDLHGDLSKIKKLHEDKKLSKSDTVILLGDTGLSSTYEMFATVPYFLFIAVIVYLAICYMKMPTL